MEFALDDRAGAFVPVTKEAVNRVPFIKIDGFTDERNLYIQEQHKELLLYALAENDSKECAFVFSRDLSRRNIAKGDTGTVDLSAALPSLGDGLFVIHNHPRNGRFSLNDLYFFIQDDACSHLSVVKHNGEVEILSKTNNFNKTDAFILFKRMRKDIIRSRCASEFETLTTKYIDKLTLKGWFLWKKRIK
ncbi:hypothetical protein FACS1894133_6110 [Clostridia bacterium]|nr:hypothetical protein FACS1894133_6110 [Clostridia bacterium]